MVWRASCGCRRDGSLWARGWDGETGLRAPDFVLWIRRTVTRRAGDVNPRSDLCPRGQNRIGNAPERYRPIDIDRSARDVFCDSIGQWLGVSGDHGLRRGDFLHIADIVGAASEREFVADVPGETESLEQANGPPGDVQFPPFVPCGGD